MSSFDDPSKDKIFFETTSDFSNIPNVTENSIEPPKYSEVVQQHLESSHKVSTSLFKDLEGNLGTFCCVGLIIGLVAVLIYFVWPILANLMGFAGNIASDVESDIIKAGDLIEHGLYDVEQFAEVVWSDFKAYVCSDSGRIVFGILTLGISELIPGCSTGTDARQVDCCQHWDTRTLAILITNGMAPNKICRYGQHTTGLQGDWSIPTDVCSKLSTCRFGFNLPAYQDGWFPSDIKSGWEPSRATVLSFWTKPLGNSSYLFHPAIHSCGFRDIFWIDQGRVNPLN